MSLTGTLLAGVAGLKAQTNAMAILSDNIANINTIGYKKSDATFSTLVVNSAASTTYSPGGVKSGRFALIDNQGVLQASNRPLDIAITGNGFFPVNSQGDGLGDQLYTRAGSFHEDNQGRLVNSAGMFLQGWQLTQSGAIANVNQIEVVSVGTLNGVAVDTNNVTMGANLDSSQAIFSSNSTTTPATTMNGGAGVGQNTDITSAATTPITNPLTVGDQVSVTVNGHTSTFTVNSPASATNNEFSTLAELADLLNSMSDITATITGTAGSDATITVSSPYAVSIDDVAGVGTASAWGTILGTNATASSSFAATYTAGGATSTSAVNAGITSSTLDLVTAAVLTSGDAFTVVAGTTSHTFTVGTGTGQFTTLQQLVNLINANSDIQASIVGSSSAPQIQIHSQQALTITDSGAGTAVATLFGASPATASATAADMQSGTVQPQFSRQIQLFDSLGTAHNVTAAFIRVDTNRWAYELYTSDAQGNGDDTQIAGTATGRGLLSAGNITFNGDGSLNSVTGTPPLYTGTPLEPTQITANWANGASAGTIAFNFGTPGAIGTGLTDGLTQFASQYNVAFINQDGSAVGLRTGVTIDKDGFVIASFSNGATQKIFQVPITTFADPTALLSENGNTFAQTVASGSFNWRIANTGGAGKIEPSSLESSNADLGDEFSNMIITQRAFSANAKTISTADDMLTELLQVKR